MMKKLIKLLSLLMVALLAFSGLTACGVGGIQVNEKTIVVKVRRAGFGTDWLYELKGKFESAYAEQGYKVMIMTPDNAIQNNTLLTEMALGYDSTKVDLYIGTGVTPDQVGADGDYGILAENIAESIYDQPAISYNGTEETKTVREKIRPETVSYMTDSNGELYGYSWAQTSGGLVVNTKKLARYGLELPKTTNEMFDCFDKIYTGYNGIKNSTLSGTYPITYVSGSSGYGVVYLYALMAQYDIDEYNKFWTFMTENEAGESVQLTDAECQELFDDEMLLEMMKVAYRTFDFYTAAPGSRQQNVSQAQTKLIRAMANDAVFMLNGDWMLNEVKLGNEDYLNDIDFINYPVISALGVKLFGTGTSYNLNDTQCDELLSYIIGLVDENKSIDEIIAAVQEEKSIVIVEADAQEVARARGVTYSRGTEHVAYVNKGTPKKDIVSLFLRMMASDDFVETFSRTANGTSPYCAKENTTSTYKFVRNASKIPANRYFSLVSHFGKLKGYRGQIGGSLLGMFTTQGHVPTYLASATQNVSIYNASGGHNGKGTEVYADAAKSFLASEKANVKKNWADYLKSAGLQ